MKLLGGGRKFPRLKFPPGSLVTADDDDDDDNDDDGDGDGDTGAVCSAVRGVLALGNGDGDGGPLHSTSAFQSDNSHHMSTVQRLSSDLIFFKM